MRSSEGNGVETIRSLFKSIGDVCSNGSIQPIDQGGNILNHCMSQESRCGVFDHWSDQQSHLVSKCLRSHPGSFWSNRRASLHHD